MEPAKLFLDLETTSILEDMSIVYSIAYIIVDNDKIQQEKHFQIKPYRKYVLSEFTLGLGITREVLDTYQDSKEVIKQMIKDFEPYEGNLLLYGFKTGYDYDHLFRFFNCHKTSLQKYILSTFVDVRSLFIEKYLKDLHNFKKFSLKTISMSLDIPLTNEHDAKADIEATLSIYYSLKS